MGVFRLENWGILVLLRGILTCGDLLLRAILTCGDLLLRGILTCGDLEPRLGSCRLGAAQPVRCLLLKSGFLLLFLYVLGRPSATKRPWHWACLGRCAVPAPRPP